MSSAPQACPAILPQWVGLFPAQPLLLHGTKGLPYGPALPLLFRRLQPSLGPAGQYAASVVAKAMELKTIKPS